MAERRVASDPSRGEFFLHGDAEFFLARCGGHRGHGRVVGTICAAEDRAANASTARSNCLFGFFEYSDGPEAPAASVAAALVAAAEAWGASRGLGQLYGPLNLDYENSYGVLVEGRDRRPALLCGHSPPYYARTMDDLGFGPARPDNIAYELRLDRPFPERELLERLADRAGRRGGVRVRGADFSRLDREIGLVHDLLNRSLAHLRDFTPYPRSAVEAMLAPFTRFADPELVLFAEKGGETVGFFPGVPDLNEAFAGLGGLRFPWQYLELPFALRRRFRCLTVKSVLVPPEHWRTGVAAVLFRELLRRVEGRGYEWVDLSLTSLDNPNTVALAERFGARIYKRYRVYSRPIGARPS
jgi:GNAT superfamily N-acetyltransferase